MKRVFAIIIAVIAIVAPIAAQEQQQPQFTEKQRTAMLQRRLNQMKQALELTAEQEAPFDQAINKYMTLLAQIQVSTFAKGAPERPATAEEAANTINNQIFMQILQLNAKKELIETLKTSLGADQLMRLSMMLDRRGDGMRQRPDGRQGGDSNRRGNGNMQRRRGGNFGGGFGEGFGGEGFNGNEEFSNGFNSGEGFGNGFNNGGIED